MNSSCLKRISRDILYIKTHMQEYDVYDIEDNNTTKTITLIIITPNYNRLEFTIPNDYPFKPPLYLKINGQNYRYRLKNMPSRISDLYYHPYKMYPEDTTTSNMKTPECICCDTILCPDRWSPVVSIHYILTEITKHNELKSSIKYKLLLKELFDSKWLILDLLPVIYAFLI